METERRARRLLAGPERYALGSQGRQVAGVRDKEGRRKGGELDGVGVGVEGQARARRGTQSVQAERPEQLPHRTASRARLCCSSHVRSLCLFIFDFY